MRSYRVPERFQRRYSSAQRAERIIGNYVEFKAYASRHRNCAVRLPLLQPIAAYKTPSHIRLGETNGASSLRALKYGDDATGSLDALANQVYCRITSRWLFFPLVAE
jgi:hypothetical protein